MTNALSCSVRFAVAASPLTHLPPYGRKIPKGSNDSACHPSSGNTGDSSLHAEAVLHEDPRHEAGRFDFLKTELTEKEAIEKYMAALEVDPTNSPAIGNWGTILSRETLPRASVARFENAAQVAMTVDAMHALGGFYKDVGRYADAIGVFSRLAEKHPHDKRAFSSWGQALQDDKQLPSALEKYRRALELDPHSAPALSNWRTWLRTKGSDEQAEKEFMEATQVAGTADARNELGRFYLALPRYDEAIEVFREIVGHYPHYRYAYHNWGLALQGQGDYQGASEKYRQAVTIDRDYRDAYLAWGDVLSKQGRAAEAAERYEEAARIYPGRPCSRQALDKVEPPKPNPPTE